MDRLLDIDSRMLAEHVTDAIVATFPNLVLEASHNRPVLVDFWAEWCAPCLLIEPELRRVIRDFQGKVALVRVEVEEDDNMRLAGRYNINGFPTVLLFQNGREVGRFQSARRSCFITDFIRRHATFQEA